MLKKIAIVAATAAALASGPAAAALDPADVTAIQTAVITDANTAFGGGIAVMTVVLGLSVGMGLLRSFIRRGAAG